MATSLIMAAISTAGVAITGTGMISIASLGLTGLFGHFLITTAMGAVLNALAPKPNLSGVSSRGYSINGESGSALDHQIIYGEVRVGGVRIYDASTGNNNNFLHRIFAYAGHEIDSYSQIYLNDEVVTLDANGNVTSPARYDGYVRIKRYYGTTTQTADEDLISETEGLTDGVWTVNHRLQNIAYLYIRFKYSADVFPNGIPSVSAVIKGKKVYDPRTTTTVWSDNPALCLRDYLTSGFGLSQPSSKIDDTLVISAANTCDEVVDSEKRYTCNGAFTTGFEPSQILSDLLTSMGGLLWYSQGKWRMKAAKYTAPTLTFDESDLRSGINLTTRHSRRNNFNTVKGKFKGPETDWQESDYPSVSDPVFVSADNGIVNTLDLSLPYTTSSKTAQRVANVALRRNREQLTFSANFGLRAFQVQVGDFVKITNSRFGWTEKEFEVVSWSFGLTEGLDLQVQMTLREISSAVFTDEPASIFESNNTTLPNPFDAVAIGIALDSEMRLINEHLTNVILVDVTSSSPFAIERVEVQFKKSTATNWKIAGVGDLGRFEVVDVDGVGYDIRARSYSYLGVRSDWVTYTGFVVAGLDAPPSNVQNFQGQLVGPVVNLSWDAIPDTDLSYYRIRHSVLESGASWSGSTVCAEKVPRPATSVAVPARSGTYLIRAYDKLGNVSESANSVVIPAAALETFATTLSITEDPTFTGLKTDTVVSGTNLELATTKTIGYYRTTFIDTTAVRRFRARVDVGYSRVDRTSGLFDSLVGTFDSLGGLFDDLTGGSLADDVNIRTQIRTTNDNPAGTPTWSGWSDIQVGDYYARAAQFRLVLTSGSADITPAVSTLRAYVQYN